MMGITYSFFIFYTIYISVSLSLETEEFSSVASETANSEVTFTIEHSFDGVNFIPRSSFKLQRENNKIIASNTDRNGIFEENVNQFKTLLENNDFYQIRISSLLGSQSDPYILASIPAKSGFKEDISIYLDTSEKYIIGMSYSSPVVAVSRVCNPHKMEVPQLFLSRVKIGEKMQAQTIPISVSGPRPKELERVNLPGDEETKESNPQTHQSFLRRYWYLVVPMVIFMFLPTDTGDAKKEGDNKKTN